jgi:hypothetical protein
MTIEGIIRMAKEAGFADEEIDTCQQILIHFAKLTAEHEREACAKVCDVLAYHPEFASDVTKLAAMAIRARKQA